VDSIRQFRVVIPPFIFACLLILWYMQKENATQIDEVRKTLTSIGTTGVVAGVVAAALPVGYLFNATTYLLWHLIYCLVLILFVLLGKWTIVEGFISMVGYNTSSLWDSYA